MSSSTSKLKESISAFFRKAGVVTTRSRCDQVVNNTFGGPIMPLPQQGLCSYTVATANDIVIVQFRDSSSPLDTQMLQKAQNAHPGFVTSCSFHGTIGSSPALPIYSMNKFPGDNYLTISLDLSDDDLDHSLTTVRSLARFFAQSWQNRCSLDPNTVSTIFADCYSNFDYLSRTLPVRFQVTITRVQGLPSLFSGEYPFVVTHGDLSEMNILADPATGEITGIID